MPAVKEKLYTLAEAREVLRMPQPIEENVSVKEATEILGISRSGLYNHIQNGLITATKIGHRTFFTPDEIRRVIGSLPNALDK